MLAAGLSRLLFFIGDQAAELYFADLSDRGHFDGSLPERLASGSSTYSPVGDVIGTDHGCANWSCSEFRASFRRGSFRFAILPRPTGPGSGNLGARRPDPSVRSSACGFVSTNHPHEPHGSL